MKKYSLVLIILLITSIVVQAQSGVENVLHSIETNNKEIEANVHLVESKKLEAKSDNNLNDPSVSYSYQFGSPQELGKTGELTVTQEFNFPTVYASRSRLNKVKTASYSMGFEVVRRDILLRAKELCFDLIQLNQQQAIIDTLFEHSRQLTQVYEKRLAAGDANILEVNKIKMELLNVETSDLENRTKHQAKLQELIALNGNIPLEFTELRYSHVDIPLDYEQFKDEFLASDFELRSLEVESDAAERQISVDKGGWLPKLEVGYRRNTGKGEQFNGFVVGASIPLFENRGKVKIAKAQSVYADLQMQNMKIQAEAGLLSLYQELKRVKGMMDSFDLSLPDETVRLLKQAFEARQMPITDYFTELNIVYESRKSYIQLENRYQKILAQLYKNQL